VQCRIVQRVAVFCGVLQFNFEEEELEEAGIFEFEPFRMRQVCCDVLRCITVCCGVLRCVVVYCGVACFGMLQCGAVLCRCAAVWCTVLQFNFEEEEAEEAGTFESEAF